MRGMRKFSQSESVWEVGTAVSSLESGYHSGSWSVSGHTQHQLQHEEEVGASPGWPDRSQCWSDPLYTRGRVEEAGDTKLDLLDSLILEDVKERLQEGTVSGSSRAVLGSLGSLVRGSELSSQSELYLDIFIQHNIPLAFPGQVQPISDNYKYPSEVQMVTSFMEQDIPLAFPGQLQPQRSRKMKMKGKVNSRHTNYSREVKGFRSFLDQNVPLVFPGQSQSVGEEAPLPSSATLEPEDLFLTEKVELNTTTSSLKCPRHTRPDVVIDSGPSSLSSQPPVEDLVRLASLHLQSLVKERVVCEEVLTRQIPGLSSRSSEVKGEQVEQVEQVEQLLEDAREELERILCLTEKAELLAGVTQSRKLRQGLETWREDIREMDLANTNNQDVRAIINKMIRTIRTIRTFVWSLASTST